MVRVFRIINPAAAAAAAVNEGAHRGLTAPPASAELLTASWCPQHIG